MPLYCFCLTDTRVLASHCTLAQFSLAAVDCLEYFLCSTVKFRHYLCEPLLCQTPMSKLASWKVSLLNHRMVKVGRDPLEIICPTPLLKQKYLEQAVQDGFWTSKEGHSTISLGNMFQ